MTSKAEDFFVGNPIVYRNDLTNREITIPGESVLTAVVNTNLYLHQLSLLFQELDFPIYGTLGQRNISGFIGEVFSRTFVSQVPGYLNNPHADGRPDLIDVSSPEAHAHFHEECIFLGTCGSKSHKKQLLTPFRFGGMEVKSTIGSNSSEYKQRLKAELRIDEFQVGIPRINYLSTITYWGHHTSCENLLALYYDYCSSLNGTPQVMAVMHASLDSNVDWHKVSTGKTGSKKTSNTSLTLSGKSKLLNNPIVVCKNPLYLERLSAIGMNLPKFFP